jgi:hypothetical protein
MVRLPLCAFLLATAALDAAGGEPDLPLVITGFSVAATLLVTLALDIFWFDRGGGKAPRAP